VAPELSPYLSLPQSVVHEKRQYFVMNICAVLVDPSKPGTKITGRLPLLLRAAANALMRSGDGFAPPKQLDVSNATAQKKQSNKCRDANRTIFLLEALFMVDKPARRTSTLKRAFTFR